MDKEQLAFFESRFASMDYDALAEMVSAANNLSEEAASALATVLKQRGIDESQLIARAKENEEPRTPKRDKKLMAVQLIGVVIVMVFSSAVAKIVSPSVGLTIVAVYLGYLTFRWLSKKK